MQRKRKRSGGKLIKTSEPKTEGIFNTSSQQNRDSGVFEVGGPLNKKLSKKILLGIKNLYIKIKHEYETLLKC